MNMAVDVVCVGIACADVLIRGVDLSTPWTEESKRCESVVLGVGGDATNQAIVMSRLGVDVSLLTCVGDDDIGGYIKNILGSAGVDVSTVYEKKGVDSSLNVIVIHNDGQRNFINSGISDSVFFEPDLEQLKGARIVSIGSMMVPPFVTVESIKRVVEAAKSNGSIVCADVCYNAKACSLAELGSVLNGIDYIFPNEEEASLLTGETDLDKMADCFLGYGVKNVIIKIGKDGCFVKNADKRMFMPVVGRTVVDTTGAGDNFAAGFITALSEEKSLTDCCLMAAATAGISIQHMGANAGVKSRRQVEDFLNENMPTNKDGKESL